MLRWYFADDDTGALVEWPNVVPLMHAKDDPGSDGLVVNAEEGSVGRSRIRVEDPTRQFHIRGHRKVVAIEDTATGDAQNGIVGIFFTANRDVSEGTPFDGIGRIWEIELDDLNTVLNRRIMEGNDAKRGAESDVARVQWVFGTAEMGLVESDAYLSTASPVAMTKGDLRGQRVRDILDDCAQQSGKQWFVHLDPDDPTVFCLWYGHGTIDELVSAAKISNDPADIDPDHPTEPVYAPAALQTVIRQDPTRVASGGRGNYDGGSAYSRRPSTADLFADIDTIIPMENVKTKAGAVARIDRELRDLRTEEHRIQTAVVVEAADVNVITWGHRVPFKATWAGELGHLDYGEYVNARVINRAARQSAEGKYELKLELADPTAGPGSGAGGGAGGICTGITPSGDFYPLGGPTPSGDPNPSGGNVFYLRPGLSYPIEPTPGHQGYCHFPIWGAGGVGTTDEWGNCCQNRLRCMVVGDGTMTIHTATNGDTVHLVATLYHHRYAEGEEGVFTSGVDVVDQVITGNDAGADIEVEITTHGGQNCTHWVDVTDAGPVCGTGWGFDGFGWELAS